MILTNGNVLFNVKSLVMNIWNLFKIAYKSLLRNKMRAMLTMLGIVIGIASVVTMVGVGESSQQHQQPSVVYGHQPHHGDACEDA